MELLQAFLYASLSELLGILLGIQQEFLTDRVTHSLTDAAKLSSKVIVSTYISISNLRAFQFIYVLWALGMALV